MRIVVPAMEDLMNRPIVCSAGNRGQIPAMDADGSQARPTARSNS
jgi:hypothetical protein